MSLFNHIEQLKNIIKTQSLIEQDIALIEDVKRLGQQNDIEDIMPYILRSAVILF